MVCAFVSFNVPLYPPVNQSRTSHPFSVLTPRVSGHLEVHGEHTGTTQGGVLSKLLYLALGCTYVVLPGQGDGENKG